MPRLAVLSVLFEVKGWIEGADTFAITTNEVMTIDAYGIIEKKQYTKNYFSDSPVCYKGSFSGISSINTSQYDAYLYTSQTDGLPNILMEVAAS